MLMRMYANSEPIVVMEFSSFVRSAEIIDIEPLNRKRRSLNYAFAVDRSDNLVSQLRRKGGNEKESEDWSFSV